MCDEFDPQALSVEQATRHIAEHVAPVSGTHSLPIREAHGRVLGEDVASPIDVPSHTNSAMDGYAVRSSDLPGEGTRALHVMGAAFAGRPFPATAGPGQCVRVMTGATLPAGTDTVVKQEDVQRSGDNVRLGPGHRPGQNVRHAGEDVRAGATVLQAGRRLAAPDIGLLASLGVQEVRVRRKPRVAFFSTGDELKAIGEPLGPGEVYDSNRHMLDALLQRCPVERFDLGVVRDTRQGVEDALREAAAVADAVVATGGVSVGEADFVKDALERLGEVRFWKIAMKPGRPLAFGRVGEALFFGLPGNPVSTAVTFDQLVLPALGRLAGQRPRTRLRLRVPCVTPLNKTPGRADYQRGILESDASGRWVVRTTGPQGSGILSSVTLANCYIILPVDWADVAPGTEVEVEPFTGFLSTHFDS